MHAADCGDAALCAALLWRGADLGRRSRHGLSALDLAERGHLAVLQEPDQAAAFSRVFSLLAWAGGKGKRQAADMPSSLPREAGQLAPAALKERCRGLGLCLRRQGLPHDAAEAVLAALLALELQS